MRRWPWVRIAVSVVLGIVLTLVMAWVVPNITQPRYASYPGHSLDALLYMYPEHEHLAAFTTIVVASDGSSGGLEFHDGNPPWWADEPRADLEDVKYIRVVGVGFPTRCFKRTTRASEFLNPKMQGEIRVELPRWLQRLNPNMPGTWHVGTTPIWPNVLINIFSWTGVVMAILIAPGMILAFVRRRGGCCPACGYSLAGVTASACPECGRAVRKSGPGLATEA